MKKTKASIILIITTTLAVLLIPKQPEPIKAPIVRVQRSDVHVTVALSGKLTYQDEQLITSPYGGMVTRVCVREGQRLNAGEAMVRFDEAIPSHIAWISSKLGEKYQQKNITDQRSPILSVLRAEQAAIVRDVYIEENKFAAPGTVLLRTTSNQQEIVCHANPKDAQKITEGMWAWLYDDREKKGIAKVLKIGKQKSDKLTGMNYISVSLQPEKHIDLPEGNNIDVYVHIAGSDDVLSIPVEAITRRNTVWWADGGICREIPAQIVMNDEMRAWVNLPEGMQIAIGEFKDGQSIAEAVK